MPDREYTNGAFKHLIERNELKLDDLQTTIKKGFEDLREELRLSREQGHIPVPIVLVIIRAISYPYAAVIIFLTGFKALSYFFGG